MSSGSSRAESAVEPTRSKNITVSWRRSACGDRRVGRRGGCRAGSRRAAIAFSSRLRWPSGNPELLEVRLAQLGQDLRVDRLGAEGFVVLLQAQAPEPGPDVHGPSRPQVSARTSLTAASGTSALR